MATLGRATDPQFRKEITQATLVIQSLLNVALSAFRSQRLAVSFKMATLVMKISICNSLYPIRVA